MGIMDVVSKLPSIIISLLVFYIVGVVAYSVYLFVNRKDQSILPPTDWWWPTFLNKYLHVYERKYTYLSNVTTPTSFSSNTYSNVSASNCKTKCEESPKDCLAFESNAAAQTCSTYTSVGFPIEYSGNNLYVVEGNEPAYMYATYVGKVADSNTAASNITSYIATSYLDCSSNCSGNSQCTGFEYNASTNECRQQTAMTSSNLTSNTAFTSYILQPASLAASPI
jgi:hypothetical protein